MKKALLILIGLLPLLVGYILNHLMMTVFLTVALPYGAIGLFFLALWFLLGFLTYSLASSAKQAAVLAHIPAFAILLLLLFQEIILRYYWINPFGLATQLFYLPLVNLASRVTCFTPYMFAGYIAAFLLMLVSFYLGCLLGKRYMLRRSA